MNSCVVDDSDSEPCVVEQTIETMESLQLCVHPVHKHSFSQVAFLISGPMRKCAGCDQRLNSVFGVNVPPDAQVVRCVACYAYAHRSCAFSPEASMWQETCPVNSALVVEKEGDVESTDGSEEIMDKAVLVPEENRAQDSRLVRSDSIVHVAEEDRPENSRIAPDDSLVHVPEGESDIPFNSSSVESTSDSFGDSFVDMKVPPQPLSRSQDDSLSKEGCSVNSALEKEDYVMESSPPKDDAEMPVLVMEDDQIENDQSSIGEHIGRVHGESQHEQNTNEAEDDQNGIDGNMVHVQNEGEAVALLESDFVDATPSPIVQEKKAPPVAMFQFVSSSSPSSLPLTPHANDGTPTTPNPSPPQSELTEDEVIMVWTPDGPPRHWACEKSLEALPKNPIHDDNEIDTETESTDPEPLHYANHPFASVSRVLQENVVAYFRQSTRAKEEEANAEKEVKVESPSKNANKDAVEQISSGEHKEENVADSMVLLDNTEKVEQQSAMDAKVLLTEVQPPTQPKKNSVVKIATGTLEAVKTSSHTRKKLGFASVAGGIAGGAAGLLVAGPAGAVIGAKFGQTVGALGVILEGSVSVGVFVAGVAAASYTAQQLQQKEEKRILTIGRDEKRKVLLVRPNVVVDPVWDDICADSIRSSPSMKRRPFGILPNSAAKQAELAKRERYRRDSDIVETEEYEIPTEDKVLLLVSRSLNDKMSLPGHVYRCLVDAHRERCKRREQDKEESEKLLNVSREEGHPESESLVETDVESPECQSNLRARRRDAHGVIKHVTATLLEVRPGFASSPKITEMSATAVEGLVFGELYDLVFEEIVEETREIDETLMEKIVLFEAKQEAQAGNGENDQSLHWRDGISKPAIQTLLMLPGAHSAVDKLRNCVHFLELISSHFSLPTGGERMQSSINADSLLKMVCQHIIAAKVPHINAEIAFLEEFARDEQLLRGKEGYALVTLQASLHFLNASTDFENDIFRQDENEDNVAVTEVEFSD